MFIVWNSYQKGSGKTLFFFSSLRVDIDRKKESSDVRTVHPTEIVAIFVRYMRRDTDFKEKMVLRRVRRLRLICDNCHQTQKERLLKKTNRKNKNNSSKDNTNNNNNNKEKGGGDVAMMSDSDEETDSEEENSDEEDEGDDVHTDSHSMRAYAVNETMEPLHSGKLSSVAEDACCRWFMDALKQAKRGDPNQAALVSQMMLEGYGCKRRPEGGEVLGARG